jgi:polyhydroxybutyrate depolymerase
MDMKLVQLLACVIQLATLTATKAQTIPHGDLPNGFRRLELQVDGATREALIYTPSPAKATNSPVVFVFHGHGGNARQAARSFAMDREWPEAISVYMQGLNTPGPLVDPAGKRPGWQNLPGTQGNRDLNFFDAVLALVKKDYKVDEKRIYATGHSNGGGFTYLLWAERDELFAAVAPSAAVAVYVNRLSPKPMMHLAGEQDSLVKFAWQERMMKAERSLNNCESEGKSWARFATLYPSTNGTPVVTFVHPGGHQFHHDAPGLIARFFKEHSLR